MSRYDFSSFANSAVSFPTTTTRTYREPDGSRVRVQETITRTRTPVFTEPTSFSRTEHIRSPPTTRVQSSVNKGAGRPGVVESSSEYETGPDGRPSHYASTVYRSPYGKVYRFNSHY